jgi:predicted transcriptional regulator
VDDIMVLVDTKEAEHLKEHLTKCFGMVQSEIRAKLLYLGMQIDIQDEGAVLDM